MYDWKYGVASRYLFVNKNSIICSENKNTISIIGRENDKVLTTKLLYICIILAESVSFTDAMFCTFTWQIESYICIIPGIPKKAMLYVAYSSTVRYDIQTNLSILAQIVFKATAIPNGNEYASCSFNIELEIKLRVIGKCLFI